MPAGQDQIYTGDLLAASLASSDLATLAFSHGPWSATIYAWGIQSAFNQVTHGEIFGGKIVIITLHKYTSLVGLVKLSLENACH